MKVFQGLKTLRKQTIAGLVAIFALSFSQFLVADNMTMPVSEQGNMSMHAPKNGQKMENVESQFGTPIERVAAVGEPPISKWVYSDFTVYFENEIVLHSVLHSH